MDKWRLNTLKQIHELREIVGYVKSLHIKICQTQIVTDIEKQIVLNWIYELEDRIRELESSIILDDIINNYVQ